MQESWTQFIYVRCQNTNRGQASTSSTKPSSSKKAKVNMVEKHLYASLVSDGEDDVSMERNVEILKQNISKGNSKASAVRSLIQRTFPQRRRWILETVVPLNEILSVYPHLSKPSYVCVKPTFLLPIY